MIVLKPLIRIGPVAGLLAASAALAQSPPMPPPRPGAPTAAPAANAPVAGQRTGVSLDQATIVEKANAYLNSLSALSADFTQVGGDGRQYRGKLYVQKPGKLRFEYDPPAVIQVISDGTSVVVRDRKLATQDMYAIGQTPLKFLLKSQIDLSRDTSVIRVGTEGNNASLTLEDRNTFGGVSRITLNFDASSFILKSWRIRDPQGHDTFVALSNIDTSARPDANNFYIDYQRDPTK
ncbi:MAG: outer-membrane lipoprotein carrier protein LolA [Rhizobiales bacterium]|nr:outer-membrane lipoprotein carrier protein LolA [Hyphomicrobiales bacterium]